MTEWWGEFSMSTECKYDEEAEYKFPLDKEPFPNGSQMYIPPSKYVFSKTGNGKYTWIMRDNEGRNTEWKFTFNGYKCMVVSFWLKESHPRTFQPQALTPDYSTMNFSTMNFEP